MKTDEITNQARFVKELVSLLPDDSTAIGTYGYREFSKHRVIIDIQRVRRELLVLEKMIKENVW